MNSEYVDHHDITNAVHKTVMRRLDSLYCTQTTEYMQLNLHVSFLHLGLLNLGDASSRLGAHAATAPVLPDLIEPLVVVGLHSLHQLGEGAAVARLNLD